MTLDSKRTTIVNLLWGGTLPSETPTVSTSITPALHNQISSSFLTRTDRWAFVLDTTNVALENTKMNVLLYRSTRSTGEKMAIVGQGHSHVSTPGIPETIEMLLEGGFDCALVNMPNYDENRGTDPWSNHNVFTTLADEDAMASFLEGYAKTVNYAETLGWRTFVMTGLSGGGWGTHVYSALDERIRYSAPVAGALPFALRSTPELGDWEQLQARTIYATADYEDLFAMACTDGRQQRQILNEDDDSVFWARDRHDDIDAYEERVNDALTTDGEPRNFSVWIDLDSATHQISSAATAVIKSDLVSLGYIYGDGSRRRGGKPSFEGSVAEFKRFGMPGWSTVPGYNLFRKSK